MYRSYTERDHAAVSGLLDAGLSDYEIARRTGVTRGTVQRWRTRGLPARFPARSRQRPGPGFRHHDTWTPEESEAYAYLLGIYLGDGHLGRRGASSSLSIYMDLQQRAIIDEVKLALTRLLPSPVRTFVRPGTRSMRLTTNSACLPLLFPQHGAGKKHERRIELVAWQQQIVDAHARPFLRGLIHSDGCRCVNEFEIELKDGIRRYSYPRYFFSNLSDDIRELFCAGCDRLGIRWSMSNHRNVSISHRRSVALLDEFVGPKS